MKQNSNPWPGLASYKDPKEYYEGESYLFCGRQNETYDLLQLIENRSVVTLYGSTGIGKTSLLCAGVFPVLRQRTDYRSESGHNNKFYPIYIRLNSPSQFQNDEIKNLSYSEILIKCLEKDLEVKETKVKDSPYSPEKDEINIIWHYFHSHRFYLKEGHEQVTPVVVLDQFEEIFARSKNDTNIEILLKQLYTLAEDRLPWKETNGYHTADYRFIISLREDKFFYMENYVDSLRLSLFKENRYRLMPLKDEQAEEVITIPGEKLIDHHNKKEIARLIIEQSKSKDRGDINTLLLSLICNQIYEKSIPSHQFTLEKVKELSPNVLRQFYTDITSKLPLKERQAMEDLLVKESRRVQVSEEEFLKNVPHGNYLLKQEEQSILDCSDKKVEVIHDQLAILMEEMKSSTRLEIYRHRFKSGGLILAVFFVLLLVAWFIYKIPQYFWQDTIPLNGPIANVVFETDGSEKPYSVPSGVLNLANNVRVEHRAFQGHPDIKELHLGDSCNISYFAFQNCPNLTDLYFDGRGIVVNANAFSGCNKIESIIVSDSCDILYLGNQDGFPGLSRIVVNGGNSNFMTFGNTLLVKNHVDSKPYWSVICNYSSTQMKRFDHGNGSSSLHIAGDVYLPQMEDSIALDSMKAVYGLTYDISEGETPDTMTYCVLTCNNSYQGTFPKTVQNNPKVIGVDMPNVVHIPNGAFFKNNRLHSAYLPYVYDVGKSAFSNCSSLKNVYLPKASIIQDRAFENCNSLKEIQLPLLEEIDTSCFFGCSSLKSISVPSVKLIHALAFYRSGLQHVEFPSVEIIESNAFDHCDNLKSLYLPSLRSIDNYFEGCDSLEEIVVPNSIAKKIIVEYNKLMEKTDNTKFFELCKQEGGLSFLKVVSAPDTTYIVEKDNVDFSDRHSRFCRKLVLSKHVRVIHARPRSALHRNVVVESDNPIFFSFKNVIYDKDGMCFNANGVENAFFMNFGIGGGIKNSYSADFTHDLKTIYMHYPLKKNVYVRVWRSYVEGNTEHEVIDSAFLKTVVLQVPHGYKKYVENVPDYQMFKCVEEVSRWETLLINLDWIITIRIWTYYNSGSLTMIITIGLLLIVISLFGYVLLFTQKKLLALLLLPIQLLFMFFFAVLLFSIGFNNSYTIGKVDLPATSLMIIEITLLFVPWCVLLLRRKTIVKTKKK